MGARSGIGIGTVVVAAVIAGCGGDDTDERPAYDEGNVTAEWIDADRGSTNALVSHGDAVCSTKASELYCLDATTGEEIFAAQLPGTATAPVLAGETLVVGADEMVYGFSLAGEQLWSSPFSAGLAPVAAGDVAAWVDGTDLVAVDVASGGERWRRPAGPTPAVYADDEQLYVANDGSLVALAAAAGEEVWRAEIGLVVALVPVPDGIAVAVDGGPIGLVVLDATSGAERWHESLEAPDAAQVSIAATDDLVFVNDDDLLFAYGETGDQQWVAPAAGTTLGAAGSVRLVVEQGRLFALGNSVWDVITTGGGGNKRMREDVLASDVAVVGDVVVIAGTVRLEAVPLVTR